MDWLIELMTSVLLLAVKPLPLFKLCMRSLCIVFLTWMELLRNAISLHVSIFWKLTSWTIATFTLPIRVLNALQNERLLEMHLQEMQIELENMDWVKKGMEKQLTMAIKEHKMMALMLRELEDEHDKALLKIEQLEDELQGLKKENQQLKETLGKARWSHREQIPSGATNPENQTSTKKSPTTSSRGAKLTWEYERKIGVVAKENRPLKPAGVETVNVQHQRRKAALVRSLFSAVLSVVVGTTVWSAEDPCVPLVFALFAVVSMSLSSVVQFFFTIKNNPASEAVALLSFNCFILGTLTYPALPKVALLLSPLTQNLSGRTVKLLSDSFA